NRPVRTTLLRNLNSGRTAEVSVRLRGSAPFSSLFAVEEASVSAARRRRGGWLTERLRPRLAPLPQQHVAVFAEIQSRASGRVRWIFALHCLPKDQVEACAVHAVFDSEVHARCFLGKIGRIVVSRPRERHELPRGWKRVFHRSRWQRQ